MNLRNRLTSLFIPAFALILQSHVALADAQSLTPAKPISPATKKHVITDAVQLHLTPSGMSLFDKHLTSLLGNVGVSFEEYYIPGFDYTMSEEIDLEKLEIDPKTKDLILATRNTLTNWIKGFQLNNHKLHIRVGDSGYVAEFSKLSLTVDKNLMDKMKYKDGTVFVLEVHIKELTAATSSVRIKDLNNSWVGELGVDSITTKIHGKNPLRVKLPFYVRLNESGELKFKALGIEENISEMNIDLNYEKLVAPSIHIALNGKVEVINGKKHIILDENAPLLELNKETLEDEVAGAMPQLLIKLRSAMSEFFSVKLPNILNEQAENFRTGKLEEVKPLFPPGAMTVEDQKRKYPNKKPVQPVEFVWGLIMKNPTHTTFALDAFVEDPLNPNSIPLGAAAGVGTATLDKLNESEYDIAMAVDRGLFNRVFQLSFERGYFTNIEIEEGTQKNAKCDHLRPKEPKKPQHPTKPIYLTLFKKPTVRYIDPKTVNNTVLKENETFIAVRAGVKVPKGTIEGIASVAIKDEFRVELDLIIKLVATSKGTEMYLWSIDSNSIQIDPNDIKWIGRALESKIYKIAKEKTSEMSALWRCEETKLPGILPLPPSLAGINLNIVKLVMEPTGHLVMYMQYPEPYNPRSIRGTR